MFIYWFTKNIRHLKTYGYEQINFFDSKNKFGKLKYDSIQIQNNFKKYILDEKNIEYIKLICIEFSTSIPL